MLAMMAIREILAVLRKRATVTTHERGWTMFPPRYLTLEAAGARWATEWVPCPGIGATIQG